MAKARRTIRSPGEVQFDKLGQEPPPNVRWRRLHNTITRETIDIFGYAIDAKQGPWIGWSTQYIQDAPCTHCGRLQFSHWKVGPSANPFHLCPGNLGADSMGNTVPCPYDGLRNNVGEHVCDGVPSMSYHRVQRWTSLSHWEEIV